MRSVSNDIYKSYGNYYKVGFLFNTNADFARKLNDRKVYCQFCGHSTIMNYRDEFCICTYCGHKVKKEGKILFQDKMRCLLNDGEKNGKR